MPRDLLAGLKRIFDPARRLPTAAWLDGRRDAVSDDLDGRLDTLLRSCIECGLCLPHCATYLASGNEALSPRGRLLLLRHERTTPLAPAVRASFDLCLGCQACVTACPSGIAPELLDHLQALAAPRAGWAGPVPVSALERPRVLALVKRAVGRGARPWRAPGRGPRLAAAPGGAPAPLRRLARLLGTLPASPDDDADLLRRLDAPLRLAPCRRRSRRTPAPATGPGPTVAIFAGCADRALLPGTARRLRDLLRGRGLPASWTCRIRPAAAPSPPTRDDRAARRGCARATRLPSRRTCRPATTSWSPPPAAARNSRPIRSLLGGKAIDAAVLLSRLPLPGLQAVPLRVAVHDPCHARHTRGILAEPRSLLARIPGLEVVEPAEAEVCCGSAGAYALRHPELAAAMGRRKAEALAATGCDLVVTTNPGCLGPDRRRAGSGSRRPCRSCR